MESRLFRPRRRIDRAVDRCEIRRRVLEYGMASIRRFMTVEMYLRDLLYVSYLVPGPLVRPLVPAQLKLALVDDEHVFVSLVIFRGKTTALSLLPSPRFPFDQVNVRTYVIDPVTGRPAVYFVNCGISDGLITFLYRLLSGMPVEHIPYSITPAQDSDTRYIEYAVAGNWHGEFSLSVRESEPALEGLAPFATVQDAVDYLIDPLVGFYGPDGALKRLEVFHPPLVPRVGELKTASFPYLGALGLVAPDAVTHPHNILLIPATPFLIHLPAQRFSR
jgi:hypothetical protein